MTNTTQQAVATIDVRNLNTLSWGPIRQMFPAFVEEIELGRYVKSLLGSAKCKAVHIQPHLDSNSSPSTHVFDIFLTEG